MRLYPTILLVSTIICPTVAEVLTQSFVIRLKEMNVLIQDQKQVIEDQKQVIESLKSDWSEALNNNTKINTEQKQLIESLKSDVYFTVGLSTHTAFGNGEIIKFDRVITNIGGGYINDDGNANYGKFIAPGNGTYQFNANLYNGHQGIGADFKRNGGGNIISMNNGGTGSAGISVILGLTEGDEVYLQRSPGGMPVPVMISTSVVFPDFSFKNCKL